MNTKREVLDIMRCRRGNIMLLEHLLLRLPVAFYTDFSVLNVLCSSARVYILHGK
jgi:hypothetical protein